MPERRPFLHIRDVGKTFTVRNASGSERVVRGCSFEHSDGCPRATIREGREPGAREGDLGFRCALDVPQ